MFKGKKGIFILIPLNLMIWGYFIYSMVSAFGVSEPVSHLPLNNIKNLTFSTDTHAYHLDLNYDDPFLKGQKINRSGIRFAENGQQGRQKKVEKISILKQCNMPEQKLPDIKFIGLIKNNSSGVTHALITFNGQSYMLKEGETASGYTIKQFNKDSLVMKQDKNLLVIRK